MKITEYTVDPGGVREVRVHGVEPLATRVDLRCSATERDVWRWAAQRAGVTVSELARRLLNEHAAGEINAATAPGATP